ncbi:YdiU family protein [Lichenibacterium minor]|uniref:Protein nucleotidyltransferase YdiU n=1 Tax=Lichenibacterium minor TaxID=2316528 RepID=A0A4Q2UBL1_9HYPH|nr:YdiU family protein [Lichenibacterium minor]RYC32486.1 YdiU family protein [Lichenibacterium minor]
MSLSPDFRPSTRHLALGDAFFDPVAPADFPRTDIRYRNDRWAARVGLASLDDAEWARHFGRFAPLPGTLPGPIALRYHGHQFGHYNPDLGDGRGFLFAQMHDLADGRLLDLGTKGSGTTPWSRAGDGRLTLNGGIREVLATALLEAMGVNTSKSFSLIETGEDLERGDEPSPTRSAVLVRLSHSHIRIGSFQRLRYLEEAANIQRLLDHAVDAYRPDARRDTPAATAVAFLEGVCRDVARTGAQWMAAGFVHGVLNTDNINVTGESFDYGPWRFLPTYDPAFTAAYFDHAGRYAYGRQPTVLLWNLTRLAECLLEVAPQAELEATLGGFAPAFRAAFVEETLRRLGLRASADPEADKRLVEMFWTFLEASGAPFEQALFDHRGGRLSAGRAARGPGAAFYAGEAYGVLRAAMDAAEPDGDAGLDHAYFAKGEPCTLLHPEVEAILAAVNRDDDWSLFRAKLDEIEAMRVAYGA